MATAQAGDDTPRPHLRQQNVLPGVINMDGQDIQDNWLIVWAAGIGKAECIP